jgi:CRISPR-associated protein Cas1
VLVDHPATTYSHGALTRLAEHGGVLVVCGRNHLPAGMLLPLSSHTEVVKRLHEQIAVGKPLRKQLWKQIVVAKIRAQAGNIAPRTTARSKLLSLARQVRSGDPSNVEAQAAKVYWSAWLCDYADAVSFRRDPDGDGVNALLNYGYAVVRAAVARALVGAGLHPSLGIHHTGRANAFCLADDLIEPLRPLVDARVRGLVGAGRETLDQPAKAELLEIMTETVRIAEQTGPLMVALHRMVASLVRCYQGTDKTLHFPVAIEDDG